MRVRRQLPVTATMVAGAPEELRYFVRWSGGAEGYAQGLAIYVAEATRRDDLAPLEIAGEITILLRMPGVEESATAAHLAIAYGDAIRKVRGKEQEYYVPSLVIQPADPEHEDAEVLEVAKLRQRIIAAHKAATEAKQASVFLEIHLQGHPVRTWQFPKNRQKKAG